LAATGYSSSRYLQARVPVAPAQVRGLPPVHPFFALRTGRLPHDLWERIVAASCAWQETEVLLAVTLEPSGYQLLRPAQLGGPASVAYRPPTDAVLEVHSHRHYSARFSPTDDADEQGFRLYGVIGRLGCVRPEVALRVGVYGYFLPVPWEAVFEGEKGNFRDASFDPPEEVDGDGLSD
jgi:hypothetical protein